MNFQALGAVAKFKRSSGTAAKNARSGSIAPTQGGSVARKSFSLLARQVQNYLNAY